MTFHLDSFLGARPMLVPPVAMVLADSSLGDRQQVQALSGLFFPAYVTLCRHRRRAGKGSELLGCW